MGGATGRLGGWGGGGKDGLGGRVRWEGAGQSWGVAVVVVGGGGGGEGGGDG